VSAYSDFHSMRNQSRFKVLSYPQ